MLIRVGRLVEVCDRCAGFLDGFAERGEGANVFRGVADKVTDVAEWYDGRMELVYKLSAEFGVACTVRTDSGDVLDSD